MLCGVVGAPLVALDVPVPYVSPLSLSSLLFPLCAMVPTLLVGSVVVVPLSLPAISDCGVVWCLLSLGSRLLVWRVFLWPPWSSRIPPPVTVGVGTWECVVCDLALWYWQRSWLPLSSWVSDPLCVPLYCLFIVCFCLATCVVSRCVSSFLPDHLPFLLPLVSLVCSAQWGGAGRL